MSTPYKVCPNCGSHLDSGEVCHCKDNPEEARKAAEERSRASSAVKVPRTYISPPRGSRAAKPSEKKRYELCRGCGMAWNVSIDTIVPPSGYMCPVCRSKLQKGAKEQ